MICDPFTFPPNHLLAHLNADVAGTHVMGGIASGGLAFRQTRMFLDDRVLSQGAVGAYLPGAEIHPLVSQGCRRIGHPFTVTAAEGSLVQELGGRPAMTRLQDLAASLSGRDRDLLAEGLQVGRVINEYGTDWRQGDFLIRGVIGAQPETGAIAVGDEVEVGQTLQFNVRDADSADQDLQRILEQEAAALGGHRPAGALLFTCNGRGSRMFPEPDHDARLLAKLLGDIPVAGFFCAGELGPVGGQIPAHLHRIDRPVPGGQLAETRLPSPTPSVPGLPESWPFGPAHGNGAAAPRPAPPPGLGRLAQPRWRPTGGTGPSRRLLRAALYLLVVPPAPTSSSTSPMRALTGLQPVRARQTTASPPR